MKHIIRVLFTIAISFVLSSCNKDEKTFSLIATTEKCTNDKTLLERHYDDNGDEYFDIKWEIGDGICIYSISGDHGAVYEDYYHVHSISQDGRTAYLLNSLYGNEILNVSDMVATPIALYPPFLLKTYGGGYFSEDDYYMYSGNHPIIFLNPGQSYSETNVISEFPMVSLVYFDYPYNRNHLHLSFYNICGLLRIKIKDGRDSITCVKKVRISSSNKISGYFEWNLNDSSHPEALELEAVDGTFHFGDGYSGDERYLSGTNYIELICSNANNGTGVPLATDGTDFYFYVPPTMMNDMVIEVTNMNDEVATKNLTGHEIQIMRSQLTGIKVDFTNVPFN